jgi:CRISPR-associated protein Csx10
VSARSFTLNDGFPVRLRMLSDWHVGTGTGIPGSVDALVTRDHEDFPCVPAKTIAGIWRDALETLTRALDGKQKQDWSNWVRLIFGSQPPVDKRPDLRPQPAILTLQAARLPQDLRDMIIERDDIRLIQALTFTKPEIKIDEKSGTAEDKMLRFAEMGRIGTILEAPCRLHFDLLEGLTDSDRQTVSALLIASARLVERIGGKRRRGAGKCQLEIVNRELTQEIRDLLREPAPSCPHLADQKQEYKYGPRDEASEWKRVPYTLKLKTPVSIVTATLGNVARSLDFIPGTHLLPHLTKDKQLFEHVANGDFQVSPATIDINGVRGLPVPMVIYRDKLRAGLEEKAKDRAPVYNRFNKSDRAQLETSKSQLPHYKEGYVSSLGEDGQLPVCRNPARIVLMHNSVEDHVQRPTEELGGVYLRQAIPAGTTLHGEIRFRKSINLDLAGASSEVRLGTSKKDDYGLAELKIGPTVEWKISPTVASELVVYLESDVLLRNDALRQTNLVSALQKKLQEELNVELGEPDSLIQTRRIDSWHQRWGYPRPTLIAMQAGSCAKFSIKNFDAVDRETLQKNLAGLEKSGIGERRGEGFGRIRFNPRILTDQISLWCFPEAQKTAETDAKLEIVLSDEAREFARQIEITAWRKELQRAVLLFADDEKRRKGTFGFEYHNGDSIPPFSQIGGFRSVMARLTHGSKNSVTEWLDNLEKTRNRISKWDANKNPEAAKKKTSAIRRLINDENEIWSQLNWDAPERLVRSEPEIEQELWAEAVRALFDACARAHQRKGGKK